MNSRQDKGEISNLFSDFIKTVAQKTNNSLTVIQEIRRWTGDQPFLTRIVCDLVLEYPSSLPQGQEGTIISQIVQDKIIEDWENKKAAEIILSIQQSVLNYEKSTNLLKLYIKILQNAEISANDSQDQQKLLEFGLVKKEQGKLKIANAIYENILNLEWAKQHLPAIPQQKSSQVSLYEDRNLAAKPTRQWSGIALFAIIVIAVVYPLFLMPKPKPNPSPIISSSPVSPTTSTNLNASQLCTTKTKGLEEEEEQLTQLITYQEKEGESFSKICQNKLDELLFSTGMKKAKGDGKTNDFDTGLKRFCKISENSPEFAQAKARLETWHKQEQYKQVIENYIKEVKGVNCPAGKDISPS